MGGVKKTKSETKKYRNNNKTHETKNKKNYNRQNKYCFFKKKQQQKT